MKSNTLQALLKYSKKETPNFTFEKLAEVLRPLYYDGMELIDVVSIIEGAYVELLCEPKFEVERGETASRRLLLAPIKGSNSVEILGPSTPKTTYSVEQFYNAMLADMMQQMRIARVDWLFEKESQPISTKVRLG